jgi:UDP-N-acetylmuramyl pentapeptide phosphotransferase/UDP-N-acetylglucosamine-1-phosphate transferase
MPSSEPALAGLVVATAAIAAAGTWAARHYAVRRRLVDQPGDRRSHAVATPRGGGIAILAALLVACAWAWLVPDQAAGVVGRPLVASLALGALLVGAVGWLDDHRPLSPWSRLLVHALAAVQLAAVTWWLSHDPVATALAFAGPVVLANVWNFMDGIDGIAASQAALAALVFVAGVPAWGDVVALGLAAACIGFLPFNYPRARIFMGDVGSGTIGFVLGALLSWVALGAPGEPTVPVLLACLPLCAFLLDATLTLARRILNGERWWEPHVSHAYQRLARLSGRHWPVTLGYFVFTLGAGVSAVVATTEGGAVTMALLAWPVVGAAAWVWIQCGGMSRARENME